MFQSGSGAVRSQLTWFDADGNKVGTAGEPAGFVSVSISPNGKRAVTGVLSADGHQDLWMYDLGRGIGSRFTFGAGYYGEPVWSPDGRRVVYDDSGSGNLYWKASDGSSEAQKLLTGQPQPG